MIKFEDQLEFYMATLTTVAMRFARSDFSNLAASKIGNIEIRMKRELLRTYNKGKNI